jgi:hypothetical protein
MPPGQKLKIFTAPRTGRPQNTTINRQGHLRTEAQRGRLLRRGEALKQRSAADRWRVLLLGYLLRNLGTEKVMSIYSESRQE